MNNPYQSPEKARQSPEIKGGAAYEAIKRVYTINEATKNVYNATKHLAEYIKSSKDLPMDAAYPAAKVEDGTDGLEQSKTMTIESNSHLEASDDLTMDAALAAVAAAYNNPEETNTNFSFKA
jgi:hypothetical protein